MGRAPSGPLAGAPLLAHVTASWAERVIAEPRRAVFQLGQSNRFPHELLNILSSPLRQLERQPSISIADRVKARHDPTWIDDHATDRGGISKDNRHGSSESKHIALDALSSPTSVGLAIIAGWLRR